MSRILRIPKILEFLIKVEVVFLIIVGLLQWIDFAFVIFRILIKNRLLVLEKNHLFNVELISTMPFL